MCIYKTVIVERERETRVSVRFSTLIYHSTRLPKAKNTDGIDVPGPTMLSLLQTATENYFNNRKVLCGRPQNCVIETSKLGQSTVQNNVSGYISLLLPFIQQLAKRGAFRL